MIKIQVLVQPKVMVPFYYQDLCSNKAHTLNFASELSNRHNLQQDYFLPGAVSAHYMVMYIGKSHKCLIFYIKNVFLFSE